MIFSQKNSATSNVVWETGTSKTGAAKTCLDQNGNFYIKKLDGVKVFKIPSSTPNATDAFALIEDDGNFVIYVGNEKKWSSGLQSS